MDRPTLSLSAVVAGAAAVSKIQAGWATAVALTHVKSVAMLSGFQRRDREFKEPYSSGWILGHDLQWSPRAGLICERTCRVEAASLASCAPLLCTVPG